MTAGEKRSPGAEGGADSEKLRKIPVQRRGAGGFSGKIPAQKPRVKKIPEFFAEKCLPKIFPERIIEMEYGSGSWPQAKLHGGKSGRSNYGRCPQPK